MFFWIYDIPTWSLVAIVTSVFVGFAWLGTLLVRPLLRLTVRGEHDENQVVSTALSSHGLFYGILLGLLAVTAYQNYAAVTDTSAREAASLAALYRDVSAYPEPPRCALQAQLREYTRFVIEEAWPLQRRGIVPVGGTTRFSVFHKELTAFEPVTPGQEILHAEALHQFNQMVEIRRLRLNSVSTGIPNVLWYVVVLGAVVNIMLMWLLDMRLIAHLFLGGCLAFFVGAVISLVAAMDYPYRGEVSVGPDAFQLVYESLMQPSEGGLPGSHDDGCGRVLPEGT